MIYIKFQKGQGLGTNYGITEYLSIAENLGQSFQIIDYENFKAKIFRNKKIY